jgi:hypothetical protein
MLVIHECNSFQSANLGLINVLLQEKVASVSVSASAIVMNFFLAVLYNPGYLSFNLCPSNQVSYQNLTFDSFSILKAPKRRKSCLTFIRLDQK